MSKQEQFITTLSTANQAFADCEAEIKVLFKGVNVDNATMIAAGANGLKNAAKILAMAAERLATLNQTLTAPTR